MSRSRDLRGPEASTYHAITRAESNCELYYSTQQQLLEPLVISCVYVTKLLAHPVHYVLSTYAQG